MTTLALAIFGLAFIAILVILFLIGAASMENGEFVFMLMIVTVVISIGVYVGVIAHELNNPKENTTSIEKEAVVKGVGEYYVQDDQIKFRFKHINLEK